MLRVHDAADSKIFQNIVIEFNAEQGSVRKHQGYFILACGFSPMGNILYMSDRLWFSQLKSHFGAKYHKIIYTLVFILRLNCFSYAKNISNRVANKGRSGCMGVVVRGGGGGIRVGIAGSKSWN